MGTVNENGGPSPNRRRSPRIKADEVVRLHTTQAHVALVLNVSVDGVLCTLEPDIGLPAGSLVTVELPLEGEPARLDARIA